MQLRAWDADGVRVVQVEEARIDAAIAIRFKDALREAAGDTAPRVVVDMAAVQFLDSSGLGALVAAFTGLGAARRLELAALSANVDRVFRLTRMDRVFVLHDDLQAALDGRKAALPGAA